MRQRLRARRTMICRIGADLGGTFSKAAVVDDEWRVLMRFSAPTGRIPTPEGRLQGLIETISQAQAWIQRELGMRAADIPVGVAINSPFEHGSIIRFNNNLPELNGFAVHPYLESATGSAVRLEWDINAALLGELRAGAARGVDRVAMVSVGTGLGAAVAVGGQLLRWLFDQTPGEIGHMVVARDGPPCTCGGRGCWEAMVSARGVMRAARKLAASGRFPSLRPVLEGGDVEDASDGPTSATGSPASATGSPASAAGNPASTGGPASAGGPAYGIGGPASAIDGSVSTTGGSAFTPEALSILADHGDEGAMAVWQEVGEWLGVGIASLVQIFLADLIIVGGGISLAGEKLLGPCRAAARKHVATNLRDSFEVTTAALGADSAIIGAAALWA